MSTARRGSSPRSYIAQRSATPSCAIRPRASKSAFLNLAEGLPDDRPAMRRKYFAQSDGSLHETVAAVDLAAAIGALDERRAEEILGIAARMRGMLRGLMRISGKAA